MRFWTKKQIRGHRPFEVQGASLYVVAGVTDPGPDAMVFRKLRALSPIALCGPESAPGSAAGVSKTTRVASVADPVHQFVYTLPAELADGVAWWQVRTCLDDVECETTLMPVRTALDGDLEETPQIFGTAAILELQQRAGGVVRIRFIYVASLQGLQPTLFRASRTAGPSSPASATAGYVRGQRVYEIDTPALLDSGPYTYKIAAENGSTTLDLLTGISVQADATGPAAPTGGGYSLV